MLKFGCILVYLKYWTLNFMPLMVYPQVLFHHESSTKAQAESRGFHSSRLPCTSWMPFYASHPACYEAANGVFHHAFDNTQNPKPSTLHKLRRKERETEALQAVVRTSVDTMLFIWRLCGSNTGRHRQ